MHRLQDHSKTNNTTNKLSLCSQFLFYLIIWDTSYLRFFYYCKFHNHSHNILLVSISFLVCQLWQLFPKFWSLLFLAWCARCFGTLMLLMQLTPASLGTTSLMYLKKLFRFIRVYLFGKWPSAGVVCWFDQLEVLADLLADKPTV